VSGKYDEDRRNHEGKNNFEPGNVGTKLYRVEPTLNHEGGGDKDGVVENVEIPVTALDGVQEKGGRKEAP
jgi:hypothetical protein